MSDQTTLAPVPISPVEDIVADMRAGRIVILVDEEIKAQASEALAATRAAWTKAATASPEGAAAAAAPSAAIAIK